VGCRDEVYGRCGEFRGTLRALSLAYVVIIPCDYRVTLAKDKVIRADEAIAGAVFERRSAGTGERPPYSGWALTGPRTRGVPADPPAARPREESVHVLPVLVPEGRPATMTYFITIAGRRWRWKRLQTGKDILAWDQSQARTYDAICRHTALTALAQLRAAAVRAAITGAITLPAAPAACANNHSRCQREHCQRL